MRYVIFVMNKYATTERFRIEKVGEESAWDLKEKRKISSYTDFFFFAYSEIKSEQELLNSIIKRNQIEFKGLEVEERTIYILGHEFENYGAIFNPLTGASIDKRSFAPFNVVVIENV